MAEDVRKRKVNKNESKANGIVGEKPQRSEKVVEENSSLSVLDILRLLGGLLLLNCSLSYFITNDSLLWGWRPWFVRPRALLQWWNGPVYITDAQLALYNGTDPALPIYLGLNGSIFDVSASRHTYGPGGSYHVFAGKDAARGFITGCFAEDSNPDLRGAEWTYVPTDVPPYEEAEGMKVPAAQKIYREQELRKARRKVRDTLEGWAKMFRGEGGKDYFEVGKVKREEGWEKTRPMPTLCAQAEKGRPKPKEAAKDPGEAHRGP